MRTSSSDLLHVVEERIERGLRLLPFGRVGRYGGAQLVAERLRRVETTLDRSFDVGACSPWLGEASVALLTIDSTSALQVAMLVQTSSAHVSSALVPPPPQPAAASRSTSVVRAPSFTPGD